VMPDLPSLYLVRQQLERPRVDDVERAVRVEMARPGVADALDGLGTVAVAVGSRGIAGIDRIVRSVVAGIRSRGVDVFVVPAMGSHGGATAEGQEAVLAHLGITEASVGAPIRPSMAVTRIGTVGAPRGVEVPVLTGTIAWEGADAVVPINRVKPHTGFRGPVESGLCKMLVIGLGKHAGARAIHDEGYTVFDRMVLDAAGVVLGTGRVAFGLAVLENAYEETAHLEAVPGASIMQREPELLELARRLMPSLPFPEIDVLVVERFGKEISGVGMDPNVTGRGESGGPLPGFDGPEIHRIAVLGLTESTGGNAHGIGLADVITTGVLDGIDREVTWTNTLTAGALACGRIPVALPTADQAVDAALRSVPRGATEARVVRIRDTLHLGEMAVSAPLLDHLAAGCESAGPWDGTWSV